VRQLYTMLDGVHLPRRRRAPLLRRGGRRGLRGQCDICTGALETTDATEAAQKALSAAHRLGGRFGRGRLVDHLLGKTKDVSAQETSMSTWGIGTECRWRSGAT
jgi:ATP-dependent DNA helicase RecQ